MRPVLVISLLLFSCGLLAQDCSELALRQMQLESAYEAVVDSLDGAEDKKSRRALRDRLSEIEWEYGDVSFQLNRCVQMGGTIGEVVPVEERVEVVQGDEVPSRAPRSRALNPMERGLVKRSKGTIKMLLGGLISVPLVLVSPPLALVGSALSIWGMAEVVSGSLDIIDAAENGQLRD